MLQTFKKSLALDNTPTLIAAGKQKYLLALDGHTSDQSLAYIQCFDVADVSDVNLGTTVPDWVHPVPGGHDRDFPSNDYIQGLYWQHGLVIAATTERQNAVAPSVDVDVNIAMV